MFATKLSSETVSANLKPDESAQCSVETEEGGDELRAETFFVITPSEAKEP